MRKVYKKSHRSASLVRRQSMREVKQSFLIVCEGVRTEPDYFRAFRMTAATVRAVASVTLNKRRSGLMTNAGWCLTKTIFLQRISTMPSPWQKEMDSGWLTATRRLNIGSCCTSISTKGHYTETAILICCQDLWEYPIPRLRGLELSCTTACFICNRRPSKMLLPSLQKCRMAILPWKSPLPPCTCWWKN